MSKIIDRRDANQSPLYDTFTLAVSTATPSTIKFFDTPQSSSKGPEKTNLQQAYQIGAGEKFTCFGLGFSLSPDILMADLVDLFKQYTARFMVNGKPIIQAPLEHFPAGGGVSGLAITTASATTITAYCNGVPGAHAVQAIAPELAPEIEGGDRFEVQLLGTSFTTSAGGTGLFVRCYLFGVMETLIV